MKLQFYGFMRVVLALVLLIGFSAWASSPERLNHRVDQLLHGPLLATLQGIKPVSWVVPGRSLYSCEGETLRQALSRGLLQPMGLRWLVIERLSLCATPQADIYAINTVAVENILSRNDVQSSLANLRQPLLSINTHSVLKRFEHLATYWANRASPDFSNDAEQVYDFDLLLGLLLGFRPSDVEEFARLRTLQETTQRKMFSFSNRPGYDLGTYAVFSPISLGQRHQQMEAKKAIDRYSFLRAQGWSPVQILNFWNTQPSCDQLLVSPHF